MGTPQSWANLTIFLTNFGEKARSPAFLWLIGLAACSEKEMVVLGELWSDNIKVAPRTIPPPPVIRLCTLTCQSVKGWTHRTF